MRNTKKITFYFDFLSPYVWLAWNRLDRFVDGTKYSIEYTPVLFAGLLNAHATKGPAETPAKRAFTIKDAMRWAQFYGLKFQAPPQHPFNPLPALRLCVAISSNQKRAQFAKRLLDAAWAEGLDISSKKVLVSLMENFGLKSKDLLVKMNSQAIKQQLQKNTEQAIRSNVFGIPSFVINGEVFWGHDRLLLLKSFLEGQLKIDEEKYQEILRRPRGADRPEIKEKQPIQSLAAKK